MIFIKPKNLKSKDVFFGIASFSDTNYLGMGNSLIIGIRNEEGNEDRATEITSDPKKNNYWPVNCKRYDLTNDNLAELVNNDDIHEKAIVDIVEGTVRFIEEHQNIVIESTS